jgi:hypothetical protein
MRADRWIFQEATYCGEIVCVSRHCDYAKFIMLIGGSIGMNGLSFIYCFAP